MGTRAKRPDVVGVTFRDHRGRIAGPPGAAAYPGRTFGRGRMTVPAGHLRSSFFVPICSLSPRHFRTRGSRLRTVSAPGSTLGVPKSADRMHLATSYRSL